MKHLLSGPLLLAALVWLPAQAATIFSIDDGAEFAAFGITHRLSFKLDVPFGGSCTLCAVTGLEYSNSNGGSATVADLIPNPPAFGTLLDVSNGTIVPDGMKAFFWEDNAGRFWGFADFLPRDGEFDFLRCADQTCTESGDNQAAPFSLARLSSAPAGVAEPSVLLLVAAALAALGLDRIHGRRS